MTDLEKELVEKLAQRKAYEEAAEDCIDSLDDTAYANEYQIRKFTDIIERNLTPVVEALVAAAYATCERECDEHRRVKELKGQDERAFTAMVLAKSIRSLTPADAARELERREWEAERNGILRVGSALNAGEKNLGKWIDRAVYDIEVRLSKPAPVERSNEND